jgi:hypothetical protein
MAINIYDDYKYYDNNDLFDLSRQHGCYKKMYKRKDATISITKMKQFLEDKISHRKAEIKSKEWQLELAQEDMKKLLNGETNIYL